MWSGEVIQPPAATAGCVCDERTPTTLIAGWRTLQAFVMLLDSFKSSMVLNDEAAKAVHAAKLELRRGNLARNSGAVSEETL